MDPDSFDPELREELPQDLHALRRRDSVLDELAAEVQRQAAAGAAAHFKDSEDAAALRALCKAPVLITGSAGYLGATLYLALRKLDIEVIGIDVVLSSTVDKLVDVADAETMQKFKHACAVLHTAALHHPHASNYHECDFISTNIKGTENVLSLGSPVVHTSTTSLTITKRIKDTEEDGKLVWLDELSQRPDLNHSEYDAELDGPRNKYGRTKLAAEQKCLEAAGRGMDVCILRAPRFFPEEGARNTSKLSLPNIKVNELLCRRCSLLDLVDAQLRALARIRQLRGSLLTIMPPWPLSRQPPQTLAKDVACLLRTSYPHAESAFSHHGWQLPDAVTRIYDGSTAQKVLGLQPLVTFEAVLRLLQEARQEESASCDQESRKRLRNGETQALSLDAVLRGAY